jgi:hypothetical protein
MLPHNRFKDYHGWSDSAIWIQIDANTLPKPNPYHATMWKPRSIFALASSRHSNDIMDNYQVFVTICSVVVRTSA